VQNKTDKYAMFEYQTSRLSGKAKLFDTSSDEPLARISLTVGSYALFFAFSTY
jgi:hypothetical protein